MNYWKIPGGLPQEQDDFSSLEQTTQLEGQLINSNWMSRVFRFTSGDLDYYVKVYESRGRWLRRFVGRSRLRAEWENLVYFKELGIPTAELVAYGEQFSKRYRGVVVTKSLAGTADLSDLSRNDLDRFRQPKWIKHVIRRLAEATRKLHLDRFVHNDLKWRNILVELTQDPEVYLIDCPLGRRKTGFFLRRGIIKDLACLDKESRGVLSRTERLRFYMHYRQIDRLDATTKKEVTRVIQFFEGRT